MNDDELYGMMPGLSELIAMRIAIQIEPPSERLKRVTEILKLIQAEESKDNGSEKYQDQA